MFFDWMAQQFNQQQSAFAPPKYKNAPLSLPPLRINEAPV
jgi:hypothetical protein